uniref:Uncharacterized protein n=1 Tax=Anopheles culicifacies TaxID=139723 RepID=A0A182MNC0_9DIPT
MPQTMQASMCMKVRLTYRNMFYGAFYGGCGPGHIVVRLVHGISNAKPGPWALQGCSLAIVRVVCKTRRSTLKTETAKLFTAMDPAHQVTAVSGNECEKLAVFPLVTPFADTLCFLRPTTRSPVSDLIHYVRITKRSHSRGGGCFSI